MALYYVIVAQTVSIVAFQLTLLVVDVVRSVRDGSWKCALWGWCGRPPEHHADGQETHWTRRLAEIRVEFFIGFVDIWTQTSGVYAAAQLCRLAIGATPITIGMNTVWCLGYFAGTLLKVFPGLVQENTLKLWHFFFNSLALSWYADVLFYSDIPAELLRLNSVLLRTMLAIPYPVVVPNLLWNLANGVLSVVGASHDVPLNQIIFTELVIAAFHTYLIWQFNKLQTNQVRSDIKASGYLRAKKTMERLLADMCDAVVELDSELCIRQSCPKLAGMLIRHEGNAALRGEAFASLTFAEADRERFDKFVTHRSVPMSHDQNLEGDDRASSMYLSLKDAYGTPVPVQLFHSCHHDFEEVCHVVGVHEVESAAAEGVKNTLGAERGLGDPQGQGHQRAGGAKDTIGELSRRAAVADDGESVVSSVSESSAATSTFTEMPVDLAPLLPEEGVGPLRIIFNPCTNGILASTIAFQSLTGPILSKSSMGEFVVNFDDFRAWVLVEVNSVFLNAAHSTFPIILTPNMIKKKARFEFHAEAALLSVHVNASASQFGVERLAGVDCEDEEHEMLCAMVLKDPQPKWKGKKRLPIRNKRCSEADRQQRGPGDSVTIIEL